MDELRESLIRKLKTLNETVWEGKADNVRIGAWLDNFTPDSSGNPSERLHALYLLRQLLYFGTRQIRELLRALFRDLYKYPIVERIRMENGHTTDDGIISRLFLDELGKTRFLGMGNPSESGSHLLYYFRQENGLTRDSFIQSHQIFSRYGDASSISIRFPEVTRYVFIDDLCGSGTQAKRYSEEILRDLKRLNPGAYVAYYMLFATSHGIDHIRGNTLFDSVECIFELDETFKCFSPTSRYFLPDYEEIDPGFAREICLKYGSQMVPDHPLGYKDGQLLLGLQYNTPDNTLPIIWYDEPDGMAWVPIFKRYPKY